MLQTNALYLSFHPYITKETRPAWEEFAANNDEWVAESIAVQARNPKFHGPILSNWTVIPKIHNDYGPLPDDADGPFMPIWMASPVIPSPC